MTVGLGIVTLTNSRPVSALRIAAKSLKTPMAASGGSVRAKISILEVAVEPLGSIRENLTKSMAATSCRAQKHNPACHAAKSYT